MLHLVSNPTSTSIQYNYQINHLAESSNDNVKHVNKIHKTKLLSGLNFYKMHKLAPAITYCLHQHNKQSHIDHWQYSL